MVIVCTFVLFEVRKVLCNVSVHHVCGRNTHQSTSQPTNQKDPRAPTHLDEVVDVGAGEVAAGLAAAGRVDGAVVVAEPVCVFKIGGRGDIGISQW